jgi:hypothetical protein
MKAQAVEISGQLRYIYSVETLETIPIYAARL